MTWSLIADVLLAMSLPARRRQSVNADFARQVIDTRVLPVSQTPTSKSPSLAGPS